MIIHDVKEDYLSNKTERVPLLHELLQCHICDERFCMAVKLKAHLTFAHES
jgi:hypothetical protein